MFPAVSRAVLDFSTVDSMDSRSNSVAAIGRKLMRVKDLTLSFWVPLLLGVAFLLLVLAIPALNIAFPSWATGAGLVVAVALMVLSFYISRRVAGREPLGSGGAGGGARVLGTRSRAYGGAAGAGGRGEGGRGGDAKSSVTTRWRLEAKGEMRRGGHDLGWSYLTSKPPRWLGSGDGLAMKSRNLLDNSSASPSVIVTACVYTAQPRPPCSFVGGPLFPNAMRSRPPSRKHTHLAAENSSIPGR